MSLHAALDRDTRKARVSVPETYWRVFGAPAFTVVAALATPNIVQAQTVEKFYQGRNLTLVVGSAPGGGYDLYARLIGRVLGRHIPGQPTVVVANMPGAASNVAAAYVANVAPKDGSVIAALYMGAIVEPLFGTQARTTHDISKFNFLGNANRDTYVCVARTDAPAGSFAAALETELVLGASADGAGTRDYPTLLRNMLGARFKVVAGYPGTRAINLAVEKGEIHGGCGQTWSSLAATFTHWFDKGLVRVLAQEDSVGHPDLNLQGVPLTKTFARTAEQRAALDLFYSQTDFGRPYVTAPGVPPERVDALRRAFVGAMQDAELQAEARRIKLDMIWAAGDELQAKLERIYGAPPELVARVRQAITPRE